MPIRISRDRVVLYGAALFLAGLWQLVRNAVHDPNFADWAFFWTGGATVGTRALLDPGLHIAFERAHGFQSGIWPYLPAFAWLYVPSTHVPLATSFAVNAVAMLAVAAIAGALLAGAFAMPRWFGVVVALAWAPVKVAALGGQNTPLALLLIAAAIVAAQRKSAPLVGLFIGLLLYKPSIAAPFLIVLAVRREWRALAVAAACAAAWYLLSVPAAGGDWAWPRAYVAEIGAYYTPDFLSNAANAVSLPGMLARFGVPSGIAIGAGAAALAICLPRLARLGTLEALSITSALAVAVSPHAWHYEPVILLPAIFYAMRRVPQPAITWLVVAAYAIADASIFDIPGLKWNVLIVVVLLWTALVMAKTQPLVTLSEAATGGGVEGRAKG
jgi:Glycosyltransferase family 87